MKSCILLESSLDLWLTITFCLFVCTVPQVFPNSVSYNIFVTSALQKTQVPGSYSTSLEGELCLLCQLLTFSARYYSQPTMSNNTRCDCFPDAVPLLRQSVCPGPMVSRRWKPQIIEALMYVKSLICKVIDT